MIKSFQGFADYFADKRFHTYMKGQIILHAGDTPSGIFYIEKGHVKAYSISKEGEEKIYIFLKEKEIFPLIWPFKRQQDEIFYQAMDTVTVRISEEETFHNLIHEEPEAMHSVVHRLIDVIDVFENRIETLGPTNSYNRLITRLLFLAKRFGKNKGNSVIIEIPITHLDIANTISMTRETVNRDIKVLLEKNLISQKRHFITITNVEQLKSELSKIQQR